MQRAYRVLNVVSHEKLVNIVARPVLILRHREPLLLRSLPGWQPKHPEASASVAREEYVHLIISVCLQVLSLIQSDRYMF